MKCETQVLCKIFNTNARKANALLYHYKIWLNDKDQSDPPLFGDADDESSLPSPIVHLYNEHYHTENFQPYSSTNGTIINYLLNPQFSFCSQIIR